MFNGFQQDRCLDGTTYGELHEARANIEKGINLSLKAERDNFEKALRMVKFLELEPFPPVENFFHTNLDINLHII